jgi:hypothetical protein
MAGIGLGLDIGRRRSGALDADAVALFAAMTTPANGDRQRLISRTFSDLKEANVFSKMDAMYALAAHAAQPRRLNWIDPATFALTDIGTGTTFEVDRGDTGNGSSTALNTNLSLATQAVQFTQDSASLWVWCLTNVAENAADIGAAVTHNAFIRARSAGDAISGTINNAATSTAAVATSVGFSGITRPDSATQRIFKNGVQLGSDLAVASTGLPTNTVRICGRATDLFSTKQIAFAAIGGHLTATEAADFYAIILAYLQALGAA